MFRDENDIVAATQDAVGIVRATSFEKMCLWKQYHVQDGHAWKDFLWGQLLTVGYVGNPKKERPVCISVSAFELNHRVVVIVEDTSRFVDHTMIDEFVRAKWPNVSIDTNAMNFHCIAHHITNLNQVAA